MRKSSIGFLISTLVASLTLTNTASAGVIYSNFGPSQTYNAISGLFEGGISNPLTNNLQYTLFSFVATGSGLVDEIHAPVIQYTAAGANAITLYSDSLVGGIHKPDPHSNPAAPFVPATFAPLGISSAIAAPASLKPQIETFKFSTNVSLTAGQTYWIGMITDTTSAGNWLFNTLGVTSIYCNSSGPVPVALTSFGCTGSSANVTPAFDIVSRTAAVPEPITPSLFGAGLAGLLTIRRRKRAAR